MSSHDTRSGLQLRWLVTAAMFAALICLVTAYFLHIPFPGGYIHLGDTLIYFAACLLPLPYAVAASAIGAAMADVLTYPSWALATLIIKSLVALMFSSQADKLMTRRNIGAALAVCLVSPTAYAIAAVIMSGSIYSFPTQFLGTLIQAVCSTVLFLVLAQLFDKCGLKHQLLHA